MQFVGFFKGLFYSLGDMVNFINTPLRSLHSSLSSLPSPFGDLSIFNMLSIGIGATLITLLVVHVVRLFVGG